MVTVLKHHGVKGMHWGVRRYQNPDGTLTAEGKKHLPRSMRKHYERESKLAKESNNKFISKLHEDSAQAATTYKRYGRKNRDAFSRAITETYGSGFKFYADAAKNVTQAKNGREAISGVGKAYKNWLDTPVTTLGLTGTMQVKKGQKILLNYKWLY